jgi:hypothetical protein
METFMLAMAPSQDPLSDFATIFAHMWFRDFPLQHSTREKAQRADWTTHIGIAVRSTADLMGLFTCFESGGRTDAELRDIQGVVAKLEWEWEALHTGKVNEFEKLKRACGEPSEKRLRFAALVVYGRKDGDYDAKTNKVLERYQKEWTKDLPPLLLVVIHYDFIGKDERLQRRQFQEMNFYKIAGGKQKLLRSQPANPWDVNASRWAKDATEVKVERKNGSRALFSLTACRVDLSSQVVAGRGLNSTTPHQFRLYRS